MLHDEKVGVNKLSDLLTFWWIAAVVESLIIIPSFCAERNPTPCNTDIINAETSKPRVERARNIRNIAFREGVWFQTCSIEISSSCIIWGGIHDYEVLPKISNNHCLADLQRNLRKGD